MATSKKTITPRKIVAKKAPSKLAATQAISTKIRATRSSAKNYPSAESKDSATLKPRNVLQELIQKHQQIAFIGITHDNLLDTFRNVLAENPNHTWEQVHIFFPSDECLKTLTRHYSCSVEKLIDDKKSCKQTLDELSTAVNDLRFLEYDQLLHCGSYWDWKTKGGYIHISPLTWGANPKICPAMNYYWKTKDPSPEYKVYMDGLEYLLGIATVFG